MQIKPIVRYPCAPIRMAKMKKIGTKCDNDGGWLQLPSGKAAGGSGTALGNSMAVSSTAEHADVRGRHPWVCTQGK